MVLKEVVQYRMRTQKRNCQVQGGYQTGYLPREAASTEGDIKKGIEYILYSRTHIYKEQLHRAQSTVTASPCN